MTAVLHYDVALSFLSKDLDLANDLRQRLEPSLSVFVFDRHKEDLLGADGMDRFAAVFKEQTRLAVVLHREGWGHTPWTAFEDSHIRSRALETHMSSFMLVALDKAEQPLWVPRSHLYASIETESRDEIAAIIRARAREEGAVLKRENAAEFALRQKRIRDSQRRREERMAATSAIVEARAELATLYSLIVTSVREIKSGDSEIDIEVGCSGSLCVLGQARRSVILRWVQPVDNSLRGAHVRVDYYRSRIRLPLGGAHSGGAQWERGIGYVPQLSDSDEWVWRYDPQAVPDDDESGLVILGHTREEVYTSHEMAEQLVRQVFDD